MYYFTRYYNECHDLPFCTFNRKVGATFCTAQGLNPAEIKTVTKHKQDVFDKNYMCELSIKVMTTLAGFLPLDPLDKYYVPRAAVGLPGDLDPDQLATILFPKMEMWKNELDSASGDKTKGARTFIHTVLPYLSEVIAQDGVLWAKHHAQNPAFLAVQNQLDGKTGSQNYAAWCQQKYAEIKDDAETCILRRERTDELNAKLAKRVQDLDSIYVRLQRQAEMMVSCMFFFATKNLRYDVLLTVFTYEGGTPYTIALLRDE